jgi:putative transposase
LSTDDELENLKQHERTGRPLGSGGFVEEMEKKTGRILRPQRPGPKKNDG